MKKITENLYQGSYHDLVDDKLPDCITAVVAVGNLSLLDIDEDLTAYRPTYHIPLIEFRITKGLVDDKIRVRTSSSEEIIAAVELIVKLINSGETVFCHCDEGICRSVGICAAYLIRTDQCGTIETAHSIVSGRKNSFKLDNVFNRKIEDLYHFSKIGYWYDMKEYVDFLNIV